MRCTASACEAGAALEQGLARSTALAIYNGVRVVARCTTYYHLCIFSMASALSGHAPGSVPEVKVLLEGNDAPLARTFLKFLFADEDF